MIEYSNLEDIATQRGETTFKVARLLTRKECKLYLCFGGSKESFLSITERIIDGYYHLYQGDKGDYPLTLKSQHECIQRLSNNNFDLSGLSFMAGKEELRLKYIDSEDMSVYVGAKKCDIGLLPPPSQVRGTSEASTTTTSKNNFLRTSPVCIFIDEQISKGIFDWRKAWNELREKVADSKNTKPEDMTLHSFGEKPAFIRRTMKQTSNKLDYAIEYQVDGMPTTKTVSRQDFGRMFRRSLQKSRTPSDSPK